MTLPVTIQGHNHPRSGVQDAKVTGVGALVTSPFAYDETKFVELAEPNVGYNFYKPIAGKQFVITGVIATGDKQIAANADATVIVYEATTDVATVVTKELLTFVLTQSTALSMIPLNILVNEGVFINAKTDDDDVHTNIIGYRIPTIE